MIASGRILDRAPHVEPPDRDAWRGWLERNHATVKGVWLVWRRSTGRRGLDYNAAIEKAINFGWVDGQAAGVDDLRSKQYFAPPQGSEPLVEVEQGAIPTHVSIELPQVLIKRTRAESKRRRVPYQTLIKIVLEKSLDGLGAA